MKVERKRICIRLTKPYLDGLEHLSRTGVYMETQSAIRASLRLLFKAHGIFHYLMEAEG